MSSKEKDGNGIPPKRDFPLWDLFSGAENVFTGKPLSDSDPDARTSAPEEKVAPPPSAEERLPETKEPAEVANTEEETDASADEASGTEENLPEEHAAAWSPRSGGPMARVMDENFLQFASYAICDRAIPTVEDGLKPVQRRILHALREKDDGRFVKVATIVGHTMSYHPHGDASIYGALVNLANKRYLIEGQGNFGNIYTGDGAAAGRYIECRLTDLAREEIFNPKITTYIPNYDGRSKEPVLLPSKLPLLLMLGANGIAVGMSTVILPHNFIELLQAEIEMIRDPDFVPVLYPDFQTGGLIDCSEYKDGNGRVRTRARFEQRPGNQLVITELPFGQTTDALIDSIEKAAKLKKVAIKSIHDATSDHAEIVLTLLPGADPEKVKKQLYAATNCECSVVANMVVLEDNRPRQTTLSEALRSNVNRLLDITKQELELHERELTDEQHRKTLVQIFVEERIYKRIEKAPTGEQVRAEIFAGFKPFEKRLVRPISDEDVEMLLAVPIRRISLFDINKNREEIEGILKELAEVRKNLSQLRRYTIDYLKGLIKKYQYREVEVEVLPEPEETDAKRKKSASGKKEKEKTAPKKPAKKKFKRITVEQYPRLTKVENFETIDVKTVTAVSLDICYDEETGFLGHALKGQEPLFSCKSVDKLILVWKDGRYKLITAPEKEKVFVDKDLLYVAIYRRDQVYTLVYTEDEVPFSCLKRFSFGGMIMNKEYRLLPEPGIIRFLEEGTPPMMWIKFRPAKGQRILQKKFNPAEEVSVKGVSARGKQLTTKSISAIAGGEKPPRFWDDSLATEKGGLF